LMLGFVTVHGSGTGIRANGRVVWRPLTRNVSPKKKTACHECAGFSDRIAVLVAELGELEAKRALWSFS
jgi:hypothetical protein